MENDVIVVWSKLTYGLALENEPQKMESVKQKLLKIIEENKKRNPAERTDNENYFARDLMDWVRDRGAEGELKKAKYIFEIMEKISRSESDYARNCYNAAKAMVYNLSDDLCLENSIKTGNTSKSVFEKMNRNKVSSQ